MSTNKKPKVCEVRGCLVSSELSPTSRFFPFPHLYQKTFEDWYDFAKCERTTPRWMCSKHFDITQYEDPVEGKLHRHAIPTLYPGVPKPAFEVAPKPVHTTVVKPIGIAQYVPPRNLSFAKTRHVAEQEPSNAIKSTNVVLNADQPPRNFTETLNLYETDNTKSSPTPPKVMRLKEPHEELLIKPNIRTFKKLRNSLPLDMAISAQFKDALGKLEKAIKNKEPHTPNPDATKLHDQPEKAPLKLTTLIRKPSLKKTDLSIDKSSFQTSQPKPKIITPQAHSDRRKQKERAAKRIVVPKVVYLAPKRQCTIGVQAGEGHIPQVRMLVKVPPKLVPSRVKSIVESKIVNVDKSGAVIRNDVNRAGDVGCVQSIIEAKLVNVDKSDDDGAVTVCDVTAGDVSCVEGIVEAKIVNVDDSDDDQAVTGIDVNCAGDVVCDQTVVEAKSVNADKSGDDQIVTDSNVTAGDMSCVESIVEAKIVIVHESGDDQAVTGSNLSGGDMSCDEGIVEAEIVNVDKIGDDQTITDIDVTAGDVSCVQNIFEDTTVNTDKPGDDRAVTGNNVCCSKNIFDAEIVNVYKPCRAVKSGGVISALDVNCLEADPHCDHPPLFQAVKSPQTGKRKLMVDLKALPESVRKKLQANLDLNMAAEKAETDVNEMNAAEENTVPSVTMTVDTKSDEEDIEPKQLLAVNKAYLPFASPPLRIVKQRIKKYPRMAHRGKAVKKACSAEMPRETVLVCKDDNINPKQSPIKETEPKIQATTNIIANTTKQMVYFRPFMAPTIALAQLQPTNTIKIYSPKALKTAQNTNDARKMSEEIPHIAETASRKENSYTTELRWPQYITNVDVVKETSISRTNKPIQDSEEGVIMKETMGKRKTVEKVAEPKLLAAAGIDTLPFHRTIETHITHVIDLTEDKILPISRTNGRTQNPKTFIIEKGTEPKLQAVSHEMDATVIETAPISRTITPNTGPKSATVRKETKPKEQAGTRVIDLTEDDILPISRTNGRTQNPKTLIIEKAAEPKLQAMTTTETKPKEQIGAHVIHLKKDEARPISRTNKTMSHPTITVGKVAQQHPTLTDAITQTSPVELPWCEAVEGNRTDTYSSPLTLTGPLHTYRKLDHTAKGVRQGIVVYEVLDDAATQTYPAGIPDEILRKFRETNQKQFNLVTVEKTREYQNLKTVEREKFQIGQPVIVDVVREKVLGNFESKVSLKEVIRDDHNYVSTRKKPQKQDYKRKFPRDDELEETSLDQLKHQFEVRVIVTEAQETNLTETKEGQSKVSEKSIQVPTKRLPLILRRRCNTTDKPVPSVEKVPPQTVSSELTVVESLCNLRHMTSCYVKLVDLTQQPDIMNKYLSAESKALIYGTMKSRRLTIKEKNFFEPEMNVHITKSYQQVDLAMLYGGVSLLRQWMDSSEGAPLLTWYLQLFTGAEMIKSAVDTSYRPELLFPKGCTKRDPHAAFVEAGVVSDLTMSAAALRLVIQELQPFTAAYKEITCNWELHLVTKELKRLVIVVEVALASIMSNTSTKPEELEAAAREMFPPYKRMIERIYQPPDRNVPNYTPTKHPTCSKRTKTGPKILQTTT